MIEEEKLVSLEQRLATVELRNSRVEIEKAWETSFCRRGFIAVLTYVVVVTVFLVTAVERPFLGAVIPVLGYLLSTQSLPPLKRFWIRRSGRGISGPLL